MSYCTSLHLVTSLLVLAEITLTSLTTLLAIMKYMSRPKSTAVKDIDIADILDTNIDAVLISAKGTLTDLYWTRTFEQLLLLVKVQV